MAKRIAQFSVNWTSLAERVPPAQKTNFAIFKTKSDGYLRRVLANPAEPPKIDWAYYKKHVPVAGMVDNFQKQYEALQIPYPPDNYTKLVDAQEADVKASVASFIAESNERIVSYQKEIAHLDSLMSYSDMTMEDFYDSHRDIALDPLNKPTFWPHSEDPNPGQPNKGMGEAH